MGSTIPARPSRGLVGLVALLVGGCLSTEPPWPPHVDRDSDGGDGSGGSTSGVGSSGATSSSSTATTAGTTTGTTGTSNGTTTSSGSTGSTGSTGSASTTGPLECPGIGDTGNSTGSTDPWLELTQADVILTDGGPLEMTCGAQGGVMFVLDAYFGGFEAEDWAVPKVLQADIPGYPTGPSGHFFYEEGELGLNCTADTPNGVLVLVIAPDELADPLTLQGATGTLSMSIETPAGEASFAVDFYTVVPNDLWCL